MTFTVSKPAVLMYKTENLLGEVSDELLFGTVLEIISENDTVAFCRTDYGYCGYINRWDMCECMTTDCDDGDKSWLYFGCDVLSEPHYRLAPYMRLSKGSRIKVTKKLDGRFSECEVGMRRMYIPNFALEKTEYSKTGDAIAAAALSYLGVPYRWGGKSDSGIDCSGLAFMSCRLCGRMIWRDSQPLEEYVEKIRLSDVQAGDIAYFDGHVAVMTGKTEFVHASASKGRVVVGDFLRGDMSVEDVVCFARVRE